MRNLILTCGAPGSGKSTWINKNGLRPFAIEPDDIRLKMESPVSQPDSLIKTISSKNDKRVWELVFAFLEERMKRGDFTVIDATHSSSKLINRYRQLAKKYRYRVTLVDFRDLSLEEILKRNKSRLESFEPHKYVPEEAIKNIFERQRTQNIPSWVEVIKPDEFSKWKESKEKSFDFNQYQKVIAIGDVHGCYDELEELINKIKKEENIESIKDPNYFWIFLGDYFDRAPDEENLKKTIDFFMEIFQYENVMLLQGNHELGFTYFNEYIDAKSKIDDYKSIIKSINEKLKEIEKRFEVNKELFEEKHLSSFADPKDLSVIKNVLFNLKKDWSKDKLQKYFNLDVIKESDPDIFDSIIQIYRDVRSYNENLKKLERIKFNLLKIEEYYDKELRRLISIQTRKTFYFIYENYKDKELKAIKDFYSKLAQMAWIDFKGKEILFTHGGIIQPPKIFLKTEEIIRGIGKYGDEQVIKKTWEKHTKENQFQIHGHRNVDWLPYNYGDENSRVFNLNGDADFGGKDTGLRAMVIDEDFRYYHVVSKREPNTLKLRLQSERLEKLLEEDKKYLETHGILATARKHRGIHVKEVKEINTGEKIYAVNFKNSVFKTGAYDSLSIHARGLFILSDEENEEIEEEQKEI